MATFNTQPRHASWCGIRSNSDVMSSRSHCEVSRVKSTNDKIIVYLQLIPSSAQHVPRSSWKLARIWYTSMLVCISYRPDLCCSYGCYDIKNTNDMDIQPLKIHPSIFRVLSTRGEIDFGAKVFLFMALCVRQHNSARYVNTTHKSTFTILQNSILIV